MDPVTTPTPSNADRKWKLIAVGLVVLAVVIIAGVATFSSKLRNNTQNQPVQTPTQNVTAVPQKVVCKRFTSLDEALKNVDIACVLDLSNQNLTTVPETIIQLTKLNDLDLSKNSLNTFPSQLISISTLISLNLSNNQISNILQEISNLKNLQSLDLSNNKLTSLSDSIKDVPSLRILKLSGNNLSEQEKQRIQNFFQGQIIY